MPTLTLKFKDKNLRRFRFKQGTTVTIGRAEDNHVTVENLAVSSHHAKIDSVGDGYLLTDLKSKNGTFVNDELVSSHWLKHEDVITIAKHSLVFEYTEDEQRPKTDDGIMGQTMVMDTDSYRGMKAKGTGTFNGKGKEEPVGVLTYLSGDEGEIELDKKLVKVGKSPSSDVVVGGLMVGKTSFTISRRDNGYYLNFVAGISKPKVNGETVKESVRLKEFDTINIGSVTFQFIHKKT
jgi:pSer/pThr/pTyr-binding forkhead associated (FHA) protein